ncbi:membrane protein [Novosphingobium marinum]|uniref:Membrane protein DedA with SNARE-associated domain n=1 Tax=Novosphingobium marinum TaxID=1514948 RepID=A0A7Z0BSL0_9SPHN|nr:DedA family protein [Novosphingobium marinum]NYH94219.1 membrane protein DedA with SNARE-associated domain [Novosphingobium marinum]GGC20581.1 membrane protein [Novosphingobium marinum]
MDKWILAVIEGGGYWGIVFLMALENIIPPIPSEVIMGFGGVAVSRGAMDFWPLLLAGTVGTVIGNYAWYWAGHMWGYERTGPFIDRWGRWLTIEWEDVERASRFFRNHGHWVVFFMRFSPFLRTIISLPAGLSHMGRTRFLIFTAAGATVWNVILIKAGEWLGDKLAEAQHWLGWGTAAFLVISVALYIWRVLSWKPRDQRRSRG